MSWRYQPIWWEDSGGRTYGLCEMYFDQRDRLTRWSAEPFTWPQGDDMEELTNDIVMMLVDAYRWRPVAFADLRAGMTFEKAIDSKQAEALAQMVERMAHNLNAAADTASPTRNPPVSKGAQ